MKITRPLTAVGLAALLALAGCSSGDGGSGEDGSAPPSESASDPAAAPEGEGGMQAPEADLEGVPDVVAEVNGEEITRDEFAADYESQLQQAAMMQQQSGEEVNQDELKQQVAQTMVDNRLLTQAADEAGIEPTEEDVRQEAADQFQVLGYIESEADISEPSDEELRQQYDDYVAQMEQSGQGGEGGEVPPFEEMRDQLAQQAVTQQQNAAAEEILTGLREEGNVTINL